MRTRYLILCLMMLGVVFQAQSQKKPLTHDVYDDWKSIQSVSISNDGNWAAYRITPQVGDAVLKIRNLNTDEEMTIDRVSRYRFAANSGYLAAEIKQAYAEERALKLKKTAASKMPKDSMYVVNLNSGEMLKIARVKNYKLPEENSPWMAYLKETPLKAKKKKEEKKEEEKLAEEEATSKKSGKGKKAKKKKSKKGKGKGTGKEAEEAPKPKPKKKPKSKSKGTELVLHNMETGESKSFKGVMDYLITKTGNYLYFEQDEADTTNPSGVYAYAIEAGNLTALNEGMTDYKKMVADDSGEQLAFLATANEKKDKEKYWSLMHWNGSGEASIVADTTTTGVPTDFMVCQNGNIRFSDSGKRLFLGTTPRPVKYAYEEDTTLLKDDKPDVDVWSYNDPYIQPMQK